MTRGEIRTPTGERVHLEPTRHEPEETRTDSERGEAVGAMPLLRRMQFETPQGTTVEVVSNAQAVVPTGKVEAYPRGKTVPFTKEMASELRELKRWRQNSRKDFDREPANEQRIDKLRQLQHNFVRSQEMAATLEGAGLPDTPEINNALLAHLLEQGAHVRAANRIDFPSEMKGTSGVIKILSTWIILPDGRPYLSTIKLIPRKL